MKLREIANPIELIGKKVHFHYAPKTKRGQSLSYFYDEYGIVESVEYTTKPGRSEVFWLLHFKNLIHWENGDFNICAQRKMSPAVWEAMIDASEITIDEITDEQYNQELDRAIHRLESWMY